jgi:hypothetical protein
MMRELADVLEPVLLTQEKSTETHVEEKKGRSGVGLLLTVLAVLAVLTGVGFSRREQLFEHEPAPVVAPATTPAPSAPTELPSPVAAPPETPAILVVNTNVPDARIELDGKVVANAVRNARLEVTLSGEHELTVSAAGRRSFQKTFAISAGSVLEMPVTLKAAPTAGASRPKKQQQPKNENGFYMLDPLGTTQVR